MKQSDQTNLASWDDHIDAEYGKPGTPTREKWEQEFEAFKLDVLSDEAKAKFKKA